MEVSQPVIAALEAGRDNPTVGQLAAVAEALQVGLDVEFPLLPATPRIGQVLPLTLAVNVKASCELGSPRSPHRHLAYVTYIMYTCPMRAPLTVSTFRKEMSPRLNSVLHDHLPLPLQRGRGELALLVGAPEVKVLLGTHHFNPEVSAGEGGGFSIWLAELEIYGQGSDYDAAKQDLLDEVRDYVGEYLSDSTYVRAPNRARHLPYIVRAYIADREGDLAEVIFPAPDSQPIPEAEPQLAA